jgi:hypothetical protein
MTSELQASCSHHNGKMQAATVVQTSCQHNASDVRHKGSIPAAAGSNGVTSDADSSESGTADTNDPCTVSMQGCGQGVPLYKTCEP